MDERPPDLDLLTNAEDLSALQQLASVLLGNIRAFPPPRGISSGDQTSTNRDSPEPPDAAGLMYRTLVEQIPAIVFMADLERGVSEAYVSPYIEATLGFSREEWLDDPIRWYYQIHPDDRERWNVEAAETLLAGRPFRSAYRVIARDGHTEWFRCEAKIVRHADGRPWFIQGIAFDITELKDTEAALQSRTVALQELSSNLIRLQDEERRRIARELHDNFGQYLVALKINMDQLRRYGFKENEKVWSDSEEVLQLCLSEVRTLSYLLHPPLLEEVGFVGAAEWLVEGFTERSGVEVKFEKPTSFQRLPPAIEVALYRILQEALSNIHRHSQSSTAVVYLGIQDEQVILEVSDQGKGMRTEVLDRFRQTGGNVGVGLSGMRERVSELGGSLKLHSNGQGTQLRVTIPSKVGATFGGSAPSPSDKK